MTDANNMTAGCGSAGQGVAGRFAALLFAIFISVFGYAQILPPAYAQVQQNVAVAELDGNYRVDGRNPDGSGYSGSVIIKSIDGVANFEWHVGNQVYKGQGTFVGNVLVVNWGSAAPVLYTVDLDGNLSGTWDNGKASERLTRR